MAEPHIHLSSTKAMADYGASLSIVDMALAASKRQRQQDADWMAIQIKLDDDWLAELLPLSKFAKTMHQSSCPVVHLDDLNQLGGATAHMSEAPTIPACLEYTSVDTLLQAPTSAEPVLVAATSTPEAELSCDDAMHMSNHLPGHCDEALLILETQHAFDEWLGDKASAAIAIADAPDAPAAASASGVHVLSHTGQQCKLHCQQQPQVVSAALPPARHTSRNTTNSARLAEFGIDAAAMPTDVWFRLPPAGVKAASVVQHAVAVIDTIRRKHNDLVVFKIGITQDVARRWSHKQFGYNSEGFHQMHVLFASNGMACALLEFHLISIYINTQGCWNQALGGEGIAGGGDAVPQCFTYVAVKYLEHRPPPQ